MNNFCLVFDDRILELEEANQWRTAIDIVLNQWKHRPNDVNYLLSAGTQLWYTLLIMDDYRTDPCPPSNFQAVASLYLQQNLMSVTQYGFKTFKDNALFNAYFGYMISVMPHYFIDYKGDYLGWQEKGLEMIRYSYTLEPDNPFTKAMYYETEGSGINTPFYYACKEIWSILTRDQWGNSAVQQYFFRILYGDSFIKM